MGLRPRAVSEQADMSRVQDLLILGEIGLDEDELAAIRRINQDGT